MPHGIGKLLQIWHCSYIGKAGFSDKRLLQYYAMLPARLTCTGRPLQRIYVACVIESLSILLQSVLSARAAILPLLIEIDIGASPNRVRCHFKGEFDRNVPSGYAGDVEADANKAFGIDFQLVEFSLVIADAEMSIHPVENDTM